MFFLSGGGIHNSYVTISIHPHPHMVALQVAFLTPGKELLKGTFCHHAKKCGKKRIEHPIGRSVTDSPVRMWFSPTSLGREKERTHKKQNSMSGKFWWYTHAIKSFPSPAQPPPKKNGVWCSPCDFPKKLCLLKKRRKPKLFIRASDRRLPKKVCPVVGCFLWFFLPLLIFI